MEEEKTETPTEETQAEESQLNSAAGNEAESATDSLTLAEINEITGMSYKDKDSALKSIKDMKSQAGKAADLEGKVKQAQADPNTSNELLAQLQEELNQTKLDVFYSKHPDANKELIETIAKANGISPQEAMESDLYKSTVTAPSKRTVADSNNRVAAGGTSEEFDPNGKSADELAQFVTQTYINK